MQSPVGVNELPEVSPAALYWVAVTEEHDPVPIGMYRWQPSRAME